MEHCTQKVERNTVLLLSILLFFVFDREVYAQSIDPNTLIQGVELARLQAPPSRLYCHIVFWNSLIKNETDQIIEFEGDKKRFLNLSPKKMEAASIIYDGSQVGLFSPSSKQTTLRDLTDGTTDALFDPRTLGISALLWNETVSDVLPYTKGKVELIGKEQLNGVPTWHVRISISKIQKYTIDMWVGDTEKFPVYRYDLNLDTERRSILSFYDNPDYPWLPNKTEYKSYYTNGNFRYGLNVTLTKANANVQFSETNWSLAGLNMRYGTQVIDRRTQLTVGYWNGTNVTPFNVWAANQRASKNLVEIPKRSKVIVQVVLIIGLLFPFVLIWKNVYKNNNNK